MELTLKKIEQLEVEFEKFKSNLATTENQLLKDSIALLDKHTPNKAFQYWALMMLDRERNTAHTQELASQHWELQDRINELLGRGAEVIKERDELQAWVKENAPEFKSNLKWVVAIPEEPDSAHEYFPAESKEIAYRALKRYKNMMTNHFANHPDLAQTINDSMHVCLWHGTDDEYEALKSKSFYDEDWFKQPMFNCRSAEEIQEAFRDKDIVHCFNGEKELITDSIEEAKRFYGVM